MLKEREQRREEHRRLKAIDRKNSERIDAARKRDRARRLGNPETKSMKKHTAKDEGENEEEDKDADATISKKLEDKDGDSSETAKADAKRPDENIAGDQKATSFTQKNAEEFGDAFEQMAEGNAGQEDSENEDDGNKVQLRKDATAETEEEGGADLIVNEMKDISETKSEKPAKDSALSKDDETKEKTAAFFDGKDDSDEEKEEEEEKDESDDEVQASKKIATGEKTNAPKSDEIKAEKESAEL